MILELFKAIGLNTSLMVDLMAAAGLVGMVIVVMVAGALKGMGPVINGKLYNKGVAFIDHGGIETQITNYPRGANEIVYEHKNNKYSWDRPQGVERLLPNKVAYVLCNVGKPGVAFNQYLAEETTQANKTIDSVVPDAQGMITQGEAISIQKAADILNKVRQTLSPKGQANTIDDRAKQLADKKLGDVNKTVLYGAGVGIVIIAAVFGYLLMTKGMEYKICAEALKAIPSTTTITLPPLD